MSTAAGGRITEVSKEKTQTSELGPGMLESPESDRRRQKFIRPRTRGPTRRRGSALARQSCAAWQAGGGRLSDGGQASIVRRRMPIQCCWTSTRRLTPKPRSFWNAMASRAPAQRAENISSSTSTIRDRQPFADELDRWSACATAEMIRLAREAGVTITQSNLPVHRDPDRHRRVLLQRHH
jgi:hypothetical protein